MSNPSGICEKTWLSSRRSADWFTVCAIIMVLAHSVELLRSIPTALRKVRRRDANCSFLPLRAVSRAGSALPPLRSGSALLRVSLRSCVRRDSLRAAGRRYQSTRAGRFAHADRSRRYRQRCNNVTHHSPPLVPDGSRLKGPPKEGIVALGDGTAGVVPSIEPWCRRCGSSVPLFFRRGFVRRRGTCPSIRPWRSNR